MKVSVIVPAYKAEKTIDDCLDGLQKQNYPKEKYEVIIVDDGSPDNIKDVAEKYPFKYIRQENKGPASARNRGVKEAVNDIILFTDSDCIPDVNWIREMVRQFKENQGVVAVKGAYKTYQKKLTARFVQAEFEERYDICKSVNNINMVDTYSAAFKKNVFWQAGGFDESFPTANNEDTELSYKISSMGHKMAFNPQAIVYHMGHPDSLKRYIIQKFWRGYWRMVVYKRFPAKMLKDGYTPQMLKVQIGLLFLIFLSILLLPIFPYFVYLLCILFLFTTLPFVFKTVKTDLKVSILSPFYLFIRALSIGSGVLFYFTKKKS